MRVGSVNSDRAPPPAGREASGDYRAADARPVWIGVDLPGSYARIHLRSRRSAACGSSCTNRRVARVPIPLAMVGVDCVRNLYRRSSSRETRRQLPEIAFRRLGSLSRGMWLPDRERPNAVPTPNLASATTSAASLWPKAALSRKEASAHEDLERVFTRSPSRRRARTDDCNASAGQTPPFTILQRSEPALTPSIKTARKS